MPPGALEFDARREADIDLSIEQTLGTVLGVAIMNAFAIGEDAGKFQAEREAGYPMLSQAEAMSMEDGPIAQAETRVRTVLAEK